LVGRALFFNFVPLVCRCARWYAKPSKKWHLSWALRRRDTLGRVTESWRENGLDSPGKGKGKRGARRTKAGRKLIPRCQRQFMGACWSLLQPPLAAGLQHRRLSQRQASVPQRRHTCTPTRAWTRDSHCTGWAHSAAQTEANQARPRSCVGKQMQQGAGGRWRTSIIKPREAITSRTSS
jgi:hypothetical protein